MIIKREKEYQQLCDAYDAQENRLVILTGRLGVGKSTLVKEFAKDKLVYYYQATECSGKQQKELMQRTWERLYSLEEREKVAESGIAQTKHVGKKSGYMGIFYRARNAAHRTAPDKKLVIVLEDFLRIAKNDPDIYKAIVELMQEEEKIMFVLTASTLIWREEEAKIEPRSFVGQITDRIFLNTFQFLEMVKYFPTLSVGDIIQIYALLGGVPAYLKYWDVTKNCKENIIHLFLKPDAVLADEACSYMRTNLRELALYSTVLSAMSEGVTRLNDMFVTTGFNRAKISVYMKNLKQLGIVNRCRTLDVKCQDQEIKGMYEITDPLVHFWYRFLYANQTLLLQIEPEEFYDREIAPALKDYTEVYFDRVCSQYLNLMNVYGKLPIHMDRAGAWYGREGHIPMLAVDQEGSMLVMYSKWSDEPFGNEDLEKILRYLMQAGINPECYYLFSKSNFDEGLRKKASFVQNMELVDLNDM